MINLYEVVQMARSMWRAASSHERLGLVVLAWFHVLTIVSMFASQGLDLAAKVVWLVGLAVITYGQLSSVVDRAIQQAITDEFMSTLDSVPVLYDYAGMDHVYTFGVGWQKRDEVADTTSG